MHQQLTGHVTQADKAQSDYYYVPFVLPTAARRLHVRYTYSAPMSSDQVTGGNVIDLGLFDPRGHEFPGGAGFRGWSGSARTEFTITPETATPGYLPGPLPAGEYQVILGLYRIWDQGADYVIEIEAELDEDGQSTLPATLVEREATNVAPPPLSPGEPLLWLRGDLQSHTYHSDAKGSLEQLVGKARALGLDFLAVTDHNTISHHPHLAALAGDDLLLLHGQEVTTYYGHMNVWGTRRWCDFRAKRAADLAAIIDLAHANGGLCSINHPKQGGPAWEYGYELPFDTMEVWQGPWPYRNAESLALWEQLLMTGQQIRVVGGSDYHCPADVDTNLLRLGQPTTWVHVKERSHRGIYEALTTGRTSISSHPTGPRIELTAQVTGSEQMVAMGASICVQADESLTVTATVIDGVGYTLHFVVDGQQQDGRPINTANQRHALTATVQRYVRAELVGDLPAEQVPPDAPVDLDRRNWRWALSNPIFVQSKP